jgi:hypothetical protein
LLRKATIVIWVALIRREQEIAFVCKGGVSRRHASLQREAKMLQVRFASPGWDRTVRRDKLLYQRLALEALLDKDLE